MIPSRARPRRGSAEQACRGCAPATTKMTAVSDEGGGPQPGAPSVIAPGTGTSLSGGLARRSKALAMKRHNSVRGCDWWCAFHRASLRVGCGVGAQSGGHQHPSIRFQSSLWQSQRACLQDGAPGQHLHAACTRAQRAVGSGHRHVRQGGLTPVGSSDDGRASALSAPAGAGERRAGPALQADHRRVRHGQEGERALRGRCRSSVRSVEEQALPRPEGAPLSNNVVGAAPHPQGERLESPACVPGCGVRRRGPSPCVRSCSA